MKPKHDNLLSNFACFVFNCNLRHYTTAAAAQAGREPGAGNGTSGGLHVAFTTVDLAACDVAARVVYDPLAGWVQVEGPRVDCCIIRYPVRTRVVGS